MERLSGKLMCSCLFSCFQQVNAKYFELPIEKRKKYGFIESKQFFQRHSVCNNQERSITTGKTRKRHEDSKGYHNFLYQYYWILQKSNSVRSLDVE